MASSMMRAARTPKPVRSSCGVEALSKMFSGLEEQSFLSADLYDLARLRVPSSALFQLPDAENSKAPKFYTPSGFEVLDDRFEHRIDDAFGVISGQAITGGRNALYQITA
jgi:hypothetical protein